MENHSYDEESKPYHSLTEMMAFTKPKGLENYRFYRIEYGGHAMDCVYEGAIWLPENVDREEIEKIINMEKDDDITSLHSEIELRKRDRKLLHMDEREQFERVKQKLLDNIPGDTPIDKAWEKIAWKAWQAGFHAKMRQKDELLKNILEAKYDEEIYGSIEYAREALSTEEVSDE